MPYEGVFADWPTGKDFESSTPSLWPPIDRKLASIRATVSSKQERTEKFGASPSSTDRIIVSCPNEDETWEWDGRRWLTHDHVPREYPAYWYDGLDMTPLEVGSGGVLKSTYQRRGHWCDMSMALVLGDGGNVGQGGGEKFYFYLSYPPYDMYQTGTARIRLADTREWVGSVGFVDNNTIYVGLNGNRLNKDLIPWDNTKGNQILMQMTYRLKV